MKNKNITKLVYCFDFDQTIVTTSARIHVYRNGAHVKSMDSKEYNFYVKQPGDVLDFSEFDDGELILNAKKYKVWPTLRNVSNAIREKKSNSVIYILTARSKVVQPYIYEFLKKNGIEINISNIITIGDYIKHNSISEQKRKILTKLSKKYIVNFFDDDPKNIELAASIPGVKTRLIENKLVNTELIPDNLINIFYKRIENLIKTHRDNGHPLIKKELERIKELNGKIPKTIEDLLKKNNINEKFVEDSDPIKDLGIGLIHKRVFKGIGDAAKWAYLFPEVCTEGNVNDWKEYFEEWTRIQQEYDYEQSQKIYSKLRIIKWFRDNIKFIPYTQYKIGLKDAKHILDRVKEITYEKMNEDFAGVGTVPGMGNVVPATSTNIGSGDNFGNTIGNKLYTQAKSVRTDKKKKRTIRKRKVNEKFTQNSDPIHDLGIGMKRKYDEEVDDFIVNLAETLPSAMEIYLPVKERIKLYNLVKYQHYKVKTISWDEDDDPDSQSNWGVPSQRWINKHIQKYLDKSWKQFWYEDNYSSVEYILIKENASTIKEEQVSPYDKIGQSMLKKAKVKNVFKKKKEKGNQNAVTQQKFEHEIIPFEQFKKLNEN